MEQLLKFWNYQYVCIYLLLSPPPHFCCVNRVLLRLFFVSAKCQVWHQLRNSQENGTQFFAKPSFLHHRWEKSMMQLWKPHTVNRTHCRWTNILVFYLLLILSASQALAATGTMTCTHRPFQHTGSSSGSTSGGTTQDSFSTLPLRQKIRIIKIEN